MLPLLLAATLAADPPDAYFRDQVRRLAAGCLTDLPDRGGWVRHRPELRRQCLEMIGLWPPPARTDLRATVTGTADAPKYTVERLHFQSVPGLYVTANLYVPRPAPSQGPAVLYLCGHGNHVENGVSYGSKVNYRRHPAWFAEHGYVCLVLDTLQLGEIPGEHHGTYRLKQWWWQTVGYTPAGVECWNAVRALDYLETRPEVDPKRVGVTGRSGGGASSWWLAAADDRPACVVPVAGVADLQAHLVEGAVPRFKDGVVSGHCDCMYFVNGYRWDFPQVAALCAPRPLLLGNSDVDDIFPVPGYRRLAAKVRRVYDLHGAGDRFALLETRGPHKDTPELRTGAFRWMNRWLKGDDSPVADDEPHLLPPERLKVFDRLPADAINGRIAETFRPAATPRVPAAAEWPRRSAEWRRFLLDKVFAGWPASPPALDARPAADVTDDGVRLRAWDFTSETGVELRLWLATAAGVEPPSLAVLSVLGEADWTGWCAGLGPAFAGALRADGPVKRDDALFDQNRRAMLANKWAFAAVAPRGVGPTRWAEAGSKEDTHVRRRFALAGQTLDGQRVWDVRRAVAALRGGLPGVPVWLQGKGEAAVLALYAGLFEPDVARFDLWHPPPSHRDGPTFLNVRLALDTPQAVALAHPRPVRLYVPDEAAGRAWDWPVRLQAALGAGTLKLRTVGE